MNESGDSVINLISPMDYLDLKRNPRSSKDTSGVQMMNSSFDDVVKASIKSSQSKNQNQPKKIVYPAHLNDHLSVTNILDGINMSHLSQVFEKEEVFVFRYYVKNIDIYIFLFYIYI